MSSPDPHEPMVMEVTSPQRLDTRDTECYATLISTVVVLRTVTEFHVTLPIATDVPLSFHVTLR